jgi:hypothetical protein
VFGTLHWHSSRQVQNYGCSERKTEDMGWNGGATIGGLEWWYGGLEWEFVMTVLWQGRWQ